VDLSTPVTIKDSVCKSGEGPVFMKIDVNFPIYATSLLCFIGWMILCFFLPTGMWGIPFDWIGAWAQRPIVMDEGTFKVAKGELADKVQLLMNEGKSLNEQKKKVEEERWSCNKWGTQRKLNNEQHKFETNCMIAEREFERLDMIAAYKDKVEPCKWTCYLVLGVLSAVLSVVFMIHIFLYAVLKVENKNVQPFLNDMLE